MDNITFELIGKATSSIVILAVLFRAVWWCFDTLPMKLFYMFDGNRMLFQYLTHRKKFKKYLENEKRK